MAAIGIVIRANRRLCAQSAATCEKQDHQRSFNYAQGPTKDLPADLTAHNCSWESSHPFDGEDVHGKGHKKPFTFNTLRMDMHTTWCIFYPGP